MKLADSRNLLRVAAMVLALWTVDEAQSREYFLAGPQTQKYAVIFGGAAADERSRAQFRQWTLELREILISDYGYPADHVSLLLGRGDPAASEIAGPCRQETILETMERLRQKVRPGDQLTVFFIGHGTTDGQEAKFVIVGPDITGTGFAGILEGFADQDIAVVNATSASYPFCAALAGAGRVIVCATRAAAERYDTIFGRFLLEALESHTGDRDRNGRVSLFEIFLYVRQKIKTWYSEQDRLPSEHPTLDDTGDGRLLTDPDPARGEGRLAQIAEIDTLSTSLPSAAADGPPPEALLILAARVRALERSVTLLRNQKAEMSDKDYWQKLEPILIDLARSSRQLDTLRARLQREYP